MNRKSDKERGLRNTLTGKLLPIESFPACKNYCSYDEYISHDDGTYYCPTCKAICTETIEYAAPPAPYRVDGDGWYYRPIRDDENPEALDELIPGRFGFVSPNRTRLYIRGLEYDPNPIVPFESLGFPFQF